MGFSLVLKSMYNQSVVKTNAIGERQYEEKNWFIIMPDTWLYLIWRIIIDVSYILSFFLVPFIICTRFAFLDDFQWVEFIIDFILLGNIIFKFFAAYSWELGLISNHKLIIKHYLQTSFILDLMHTLPGLLSFEETREIYYLKCIRFLYILKFFERLKELFDKFSTWNISF